MSTSETTISATRKRIVAVRETLDFIGGSDLPITHKRVALEAIQEVLRIHIDLLEKMETTKNDGNKWTDDELTIIGDFLKDKIATNFSHERDILNQLSARLGRSPDKVKKKSSELGFGAGVDYWLATAKGLTKK